MSVDDANADLLGHVHRTIERLAEIWDRVSMDRETREKRTESAYVLFYNTMSEIVASEEEMVKGVHEDVKRELTENATIRQELGLPAFSFDKYKPNSIELLRALAKDKKYLAKKKVTLCSKETNLMALLVRFGKCEAT